MSESIWQRENCGPGREYMLGKELHVKFDDRETIMAAIIEGLKEFVHSEPAVRLTLDTPLSNPERAIIAIPFESDQELILTNFAHTIYQSLQGYYISAEPKTTHFGIANLLLEGKLNSLLRREMEKLISQFQNRSDMAGRLMENVKLVGKLPVPKPGNIFLSETVKKGLDIHVGYRVYAIGSNVNYTKIFLPMETGSEILEHVYYNLEQMLHHNFVAYDETGDDYLTVSETLVFKELEAILRRAKSKELTRNKIINKLQFNTVLKTEIDPAEEPLLGDRVYDFLNHIQDTKLKDATVHSRELLIAYLQEASLALQHPQAPEDKAEEVEEKPKRRTRPARRVRPGTAEAAPRQRPMRRPLEVKPEEKLQAESGKDRNQVRVPTPPDEELRVPVPQKTPDTA
ncbi:MAG: hypothetical protein GY866_05340 [Proteobacteria bacterium]|nr:hypothetical protein [Pseudomonadota bacterium]